MKPNRCWTWSTQILAAAVTVSLFSAGIALAQKGGKGGGGTSRYTIVALDTRLGYQWSSARDVNEFGVVVGAVEGEDGNEDAVAWEVAISGGAVSVVQHSLPLPPSLPSGVVVVGSDAFAVNDSGEIVGIITLASGDPPVVVRQALYWPNALAEPVTLPPLPGQGYSWAMSINNGGVVVGISGNGIPDNNRHAVAWKVDPAGNVLAGPVDLGVLAGATYSEALDVNDADADGIVQVVGTSSDAAWLFRAVLWEIDVDDPALSLVNGPVDLGFLSPDRPYSEGYAINDQGTTCGESGNIAFRKPYGGGMQQLAQFKPGLTWAYGINNRNEVVGQNNHFDRQGIFQGTYPVMWQADGKVLNLNNFIGSSGWYYIAYPRAINDQGWIAAHGGNSAIGEPGESRALVMVPK